MKQDVVIIGGGPGGMASALFLAKAGVKSIVIEKDAFPRFHIGESMTGECGNLVRELGFEEKMMKKDHPRKFGVKVYGTGGKNSFWIPVMGRKANGELSDSFTWQVRRSEFDEMLHDAAEAAEEITQVRGQATRPLVNDDGDVVGVQVKTADNELIEIESEILIDASGMNTFLSKHGVTSKKERGNYDNQISIFTHVKGSARDEQDNTLIFYQKKNHWAWLIPIDEDVVSVGVVVPSEYFAEKKESKEEFYLRELKELNPELAKRVTDVEIVEEIRAVSNYSYHIKQFTGKGFLCVGDSHRFIDPVFSFGLHFAIAESRMAAEAITDYLKAENGAEEKPFIEYQKRAELGMDVIQDVLDGFWDHPLAFAFFVHNRYVDDFIDLFAGRIYAEEPAPGLKAIRTILGR